MPVHWLTSISRFLLAVLLLGAAGCCYPTPLKADPASEGYRPQDTTQTLGKYQGHWLSNQHVELFIATEPVVRVLAIRRPGESSLLADDSDPEQGIRLAYLEPIQVPGSFKVGNQPGQLHMAESHRAWVRFAHADEQQLRYTMHVQLDEHAPVVHLQYTLTNLADETRELAAWSVTAFDRTGRFVVPFGDQPRALRRLVFSWWTALPQPGLVYGRNTLLINADAPLAGSAFKVGIHTEAGWAAYVRGREVIITRAERTADALYPEGDANITIFQFQEGDRRWSEFEQVGPLVKLAPGESTTLRETLMLHTLDEPLADDAGADDYRERIEQVLNRE